MNELLSVDLSNIGFATLFVWLLFYVMKNNDKRETKYQNTIDDLASALGVVNDIKEILLEKRKVD